MSGHNINWGGGGLHIHCPPEWYPTIIYMLQRNVGSKLLEKRSKTFQEFIKILCSKVKTLNRKVSFLSIFSSGKGTELINP